MARYGVGILDFNYKDRKYSREYSLWNNMLRRCYSENRNLRNSSYNDCLVEEYLHSFKNFYHYVRKMVGFYKKDEKGRFFVMDKDILSVGDKMYSRKNMLFVPHEINAFLLDGQRWRGEYLIGVSYHKRDNLYVAQCNRGEFGKYLGSYKSEEDVHNAYVKAKEDHAKFLAEKWKCEVDERAYTALMDYRVNANLKSFKITKGDMLK